MDTTESHARHPDRPTIESDPAYDYNEDEVVDEAWTEDDEAPADEERVVPLDEVDAFREPEEEI
ncbi:hypothetical protein [Arthrobacter cavernae]|uniref:Uncharacterized protein n=1 Tax=Arthrobacter cavernae TaxID=2817681 RepID=A0A939HFU5_9MICC|nr:hypothetical protein [Arthrobacter cavernae]MBO1266720.1 hypothetical protein [Arthrobacter cavernae]